MSVVYDWQHNFSMENEALQFLCGSRKPSVYTSTPPSNFRDAPQRTHSKPKLARLSLLERLSGRARLPRVSRMSDVLWILRPYIAEPGSTPEKLSQEFRGKLESD